MIPVLVVIQKSKYPTDLEVQRGVDVLRVLHPEKSKFDPVRDGLVLLNQRNSKLGGRR